MRAMTRRIVSHLALLATLGLGAQLAHADDPVVAAQGVESADVGDWTEARARFEAQSVARPDDVSAWYRLGVARALTNDAAGAADAFRRVKALAPAFPQIDARIAAADARASHDAAEALDPGRDYPDARAAAFDEDYWLSALRYELLIEPGSDPSGDARASAAEGDTAAAARASIGALGADPSSTGSYLRAARAAYLHGDRDAARYYLDVFGVVGGDAAEAADLYDALERSR